MKNNEQDSQFPFLDDEERDIVESLESDEWVPVSNRSAAISEAQSIARATLRKDKRMNVRISERDLRGLKARAAEEGIPYQTLVTMILHKYVAGRFVEESSSRS